MSGKMREKKVIASLLACLLASQTLAAPAWGQEAESAENTGTQQVEQVELAAQGKEIIEVDGLQFKDLNGNGELDVYEDWREDTEDRITDLLSQMTLEEKVGLLFHCMSAGQFSPTYPMDDQFIYEENCPFEADILEGRYTEGYSMWYYINEYNITHFLDDATGTPQELAEYHNKVQQIAEESRLGIPVTFSANREYNAWGSYIDMPHTAFGTANDPELCEELWEAYSEEMKAVGYHLTLNPYGVELGSWYGEDPDYVAELTAAEVESMQSTGLSTCVKHFIGRGNPGLSFGDSRSVAQLYENWMVPWQAAIDAGCDWIMTNTGTGLSNTVNVDYDKETMDYLRNVLGFDGVVVTDWGPVRSGSMEGVTADGVDLSELSLGELYTMVLENGVDQFGSVSVQPGEDTSAPRDISNWPDAIVNAVNDGTCSVDLVDRSARRILRTKFEQGLFENPYVDVDEAVALICSEEYAADPWEITSNEELDAARNPEIVELDHQLQAASTVLVKNDENLLPLADGTKVYVTGNDESLAVQDQQYIGTYGEVKDTMEEADVLIVRADSLGEEEQAVVQLVEDAKAAGKKVVFAADTLEPTAWMTENADALLYMTYSCPPDHGSSLDSILRVTEPWVFSDMLFGHSEPSGMMVQEVARDEEQESSQWNDLANDTGATVKERLLLMEMVRLDPSAELPNNWGDPLLCYQYGMRYGEDAQFIYDTLVVPETVTAGETFTAACILRNDGSDGSTTAWLSVDGEAVSSTFMAVNGGEYRVVELECTLETAGTYELTLGTLSAQVTVA